jgi:hypothetical protein
MASGAPYTVKWGIMATGWIAEGTRKLIIILPSFLLSKTMTTMANPPLL